MHIFIYISDTSAPESNSPTAIDKEPVSRPATPVSLSAARSLEPAMSKELIETNTPLACDWWEEGEGGLVWKERGN
jgi:hypothetical protein